MKTKVIFGLAIIIVILAMVAVLCAFTSPEGSSGSGVLEIVSDYSIDHAQHNIARTDADVSFVTEKLDGSQKFEFVQE